MPDDQADAFLRPRFAQYRADTLNRLRPAGAASARRAYESRRTSRTVAIAVATAATIVLAAAGGTALLRRSSPPLPVVVSPTPRTVSPTPSGAPTPTPPITPPPASGSENADPAGPPSSARSGSGTPRCHTSDLSIEHIGGDGHSGSVTVYYALTNTSGNTCALSGFPALRAVNSSGSRLPTTLEHVGAAKPAARLQPGKAAYTSITTTNVPGTDPAKPPCDPPAAALWLTPPGESDHFTLDGSWRICGGGEILVTPFDPQRPADAHS
jgi:hypothetical protein